MEALQNFFTSSLARLTESEDLHDTVISHLHACGFETTTFENGTVFALLLGDMPSKEGSVFAACLEDLSATAQLMALAQAATQETDYKSRLHHPDIELVLTPDHTAASAPDFMKLYAPNAYLLEQEAPMGQLLSASDPIVKDRYDIIVEGLGFHYAEVPHTPSELAHTFQEHQIRTACISFGADPDEALQNVKVLLYLAAAYQE